MFYKYATDVVACEAEVGGGLVFLSDATSIAGQGDKRLALRKVHTDRITLVSSSCLVMHHKGCWCGGSAGCCK